MSILFILLSNSENKKKKKKREGGRKEKDDQRMRSGYSNTTEFSSFHSRWGFWGFKNWGKKRGGEGKRVGGERACP